MGPARRVLSLAGRAAAGAVGLGAVGLGTVVATDPGAGREYRFWSIVGPCLFRYAWVGRTVTEDAEKKARLDALHARYATEIVDLFIELGGPYIKLGQYLSVRPELVAPQYRDELKKLQSDVPGKTFTEIKEVLDESLGDAMGQFAHISERHFGAASIAQVHEAELLDGRRVAVKVQYPDVRWKFEVDLRCIGHAISIGQNCGLLDEKSNGAIKFFKEIKETSMNELDFVKERANLDALEAVAGARYAGQICIPESIPELCSDRVLTMTYLEGPKLEEEVLRRLSVLGVEQKPVNVREYMADQAAKAKASQEQLAALDEDMSWQGITMRSAARLGPQTLLWLARLTQNVRDISGGQQAINIINVAGVVPTDLQNWCDAAERDLATRRTQAETQAWLETLLDVHGFEVFLCPQFNCDPHPGNIIVMHDGRLGLIDYGQCSTLEDGTIKQAFAQLIVAVADDRSDREIAEAFRAVGIITQNSNDFFTAALARLMFGHLTGDMLRREWHHKLHATDRVVIFPPELVMVYRVAALLRGLG
eukprot:CAMPEP_0206285840 /NCGR_PEP_ID=MMETSP0106_2-20121207/300_1 /ASSEMBLY_ACC=CAM_ASM_000206 /TAXON_ID=81532 /ORGANISM="Acanthoeca-like sp., Strain 10tr" /LENGTH=535 /DNA_ID=CAMNT_0053716359 /DNA_START=296 /DNA_END=1901 /DNA_ORIENTATION=+